jgi:type II secretory pathway component PulM
MNARKDVGEPASGEDAQAKAMRQRYRGVRRDVTSDAGPAVTADADSDVTSAATRGVAAPSGRGVTRLAGGGVTTGVTRPRRRTGRRSAPVAAEAVALTVRFDPAEFDDIGDWIADVGDELGWTVDKAEVVRALIDAARTRTAVRKALLTVLKGPARP